MVQVVMLALAAGAFAGTVEEGLERAAPFRDRRILSALPSIPSDAYAGLSTGAVVTGVQDTGGPLKRVWGVGVVPVSIGSLAAAISDDARKPGFTELTRADVLSGAPCSSGRVVFQYLDVSLLSDRWWVVEQRVNDVIALASGGAVRELVWSAVPDGASRLTPEARAIVDGAVQVKSTEGAWFLVDLGEGRTLVEYVQSSDPGGSVPAGVAASVAARSIPDTFAAMAKMAASAGNCPVR